jgi:hypothetical protein
MTVKEAIEQLKTLPPDGRLMVPSLGHGGSVPLQGFLDLDQGKQIDSPHWIDVVYCEDHERADYGLAAELDHWDEVARGLAAKGEITIE